MFLPIDVEYKMTLSFLQNISVFERAWANFGPLQAASLKDLACSNGLKFLRLDS